MVVMENVQGIMASLWFQKIPHLGTTLRLSVFKDVKRAIEALHSKNLVFGDLRLQNIMVCERNDHEAHAVLVDFDWAGTAGEGRYPATISKFHEWAPTVEAYGLMEKGHDVHRLKAMQRDDFKLF
jgi:serine/threonine protein kinase